MTSPAADLAQLEPRHGAPCHAELDLLESGPALERQLGGRASAIVGRDSDAKRPDVLGDRVGDCLRA